MTAEVFRQLIVEITTPLRGRALDADLEHWLNSHHGPDSATYRALKQACVNGVAAGWMCDREHAGIRYGRVIKPADDVHRFSVDVVDMDDCAGGHHVHPTGEIDLVMPLTGDARFDGHGAGWCVYPPGSAHVPTVAGGRALVLYLLPEGQIQFTRG
jgi:Domain of unknown function (DUF4863)